MHDGVCRYCRREKKVSEYKRTGMVFCRSCRRRLFNFDLCSACGKTKIVASRDKETGRVVCVACHAKTHNRGTCPRCNRKNVACRYRWTDALMICRRCWHIVGPPMKRGYGKMAQCARCTRHKPVSMRRAGKPYCALCARTLFRQRVCGVCDEKKIVIYRVGGKPACQRCKKNSRPARIVSCLGCGNQKPVKAQDRCSPCYRRWNEAKNRSV